MVLNIFIWHCCSFESGWRCVCVLTSTQWNWRIHSLPFSPSTLGYSLNLYLCVVGKSSVLLLILTWLSQLFITGQIQRVCFAHNTTNVFSFWTRFRLSGGCSKVSNHSLHWTNICFHSCLWRSFLWDLLLSIRHSPEFRYCQYSLENLPNHEWDRLFTCL